MIKAPGKAAIEVKNGSHPKPISDLGKTLRKISDAYVSAGGKLLNRRELSREVAERRGSR